MTATKTPLRKKDRKWLDRIRFHSDSTAGMYPGLQTDHLPRGPADRLYKAGLIETFIPHNSAHKDRWVITRAGRARLEAEP